MMVCYQKFSIIILKKIARSQMKTCCFIIIFKKRYWGNIRINKFSYCISVFF